MSGSSEFFFEVYPCHFSFVLLPASQQIALLLFQLTARNESFMVMLLHLVRHRSGRRMISVLFQVRTDDEEGHAPEKDSPVAGIQAASGMNSKGNHSLNHGHLLKVFIALFFAGLPFAARPGHINPKGDRAWEQKARGPEEPETARGVFRVQTKLFFRGRL
jgi:hypothetical protein